MELYIIRKFQLLYWITLVIFIFDYLNYTCYFTLTEHAIVTNPICKLMLFIIVRFNLNIKYIVIFINTLYECVFLYLSLYYLVNPNIICDNWGIYYRGWFNIINIYILHLLYIKLHIIDLQNIPNTITLSNTILENSINETAFINTIVPNNTWQCSICLSYSGIAIKLPCNHIVHKECIIDWTNSGQPNSTKCPLCRQLLPIYNIVLSQL